MVGTDSSDEDVYGLHLMMRIGEIENTANLDDAQAVSDFLVELVTGIDMRILAGPLMGTEAGDPRDQGHSGLVILYESHCAIHTYPVLRSMYLDLFSCSVFELEPVHKMLEGFCGSYSVVECDTLTRGRHWHMNADAELERWVKTRDA